jgi:predicted nucleic acid-binding protein
LGLTKLAAFLRRHRCIALDTSVFIYQLQENPRYLSLTNPIFQWIERPGNAAVTATITMTQVLVQPYREDRDQLVNQFYGLLVTYPHLSWVALDLNVADIAARLRARHGLRTPDALQAACAVVSQASGFVTNDPVFSRVDAFETLVLDDFLSASAPRR